MPIQPTNRRKMKHICDLTPLLFPGCRQVVATFAAHTALAKSMFPVNAVDTANGVPGLLYGRFEVREGVALASARTGKYAPIIVWLLTHTFLHSSRSVVVDRATTTGPTAPALGFSSPRALQRTSTAAQRRWVADASVALL